MARPQGLRAGGAGSVIAAALTLAAAPLYARNAAEFAGVWELSLENSHRKCQISLSSDAGAFGRQVRFPTGCRRALPIVNVAAGWLVEGGSLRLLDPDGRPVLVFAPGTGGEALRARSDAGEGYTLERKEDLRLARPAAPPAPSPAPGVPQPTPIDPSAAPPFSAVPGVYLLDRYTERDVCRIELGRVLLATAGRHEARILGGCRDAGLAAFDPVAWRYEGGRLILTARRGHEVTLVSEREGQWRRDPDVGATLILRKASAP